MPERSTFLREAAASVRSQTLPMWRWEHLVYVDEDRVGCSKVMNKLVSEAYGDWILMLCDDDLLLPRCLELHWEAIEEADIVYAPPLVWGEDGTQFCGSPPNIPSLSLIRTQLWRDLGGYNETIGYTEDMDFYVKAQERGARFVRIDKDPTWVYRFHGGNKSRNMVD